MAGAREEWEQQSLLNNSGQLYEFLENLKPILSGKQQELKPLEKGGFQRPGNGKKKKVTGSSTEEGFAQGLDLLVQQKYSSILGWSASTKTHTHQQSKEPIPLNVFLPGPHTRGLTDLSGVKEQV